jgi:chromosome partitioning protein
MAYTVAITNQKGGVGKTTTAVNLAAALAIAERRTLLVDADPQGNTTSGVGIAKVELQVSLYDALVDDHPVQDLILPVSGLPHLSVLPATQDLVGAELQLVERPFRESALRRVLEPLEHDYDYIVVDCPPSLGLLTLNVLAAVQQLIIPIQCEYYGLEGISQLLNTVRLVQQNINPGLAIGGVLLTMYDSRLNLCRQVAEDATEYFGPKVFATPIPRNVRLAEAPSFGKPILLYDVQSVGAKSYLAVAQELLRRVEGTEVTIAPAQVAAATAHAAAAAAAASAPEASEAPEAPEAAVADEPAPSGLRNTEQTGTEAVVGHPVTPDPDYRDPPHEPVAVASMEEAPPEVMIGEPHAAENGSHPLPEAELAQVQAEQSSEPKAESDELVRTDGPADDETRQSHHFPESEPEVTT